MSSPDVTKKTKDADVFYTIQWTGFIAVEKQIVNSVVPSVAGIFELYYLDNSRTLRFIARDQAYYGGLRNTLREIADPELPAVVDMQDVPRERPLFCRYVITNSREDMDDILFFLSRSVIPGAHRVDSSGRYRNVYLKELSKKALHTL
jgi:hypothetical protein